MKLIKYLFLFLSFFIISCKNNEHDKSAINDSGKVEMLAENKLRFLQLSGTPFERGYTHGKLLKKEIHEVVQLLKNDIKVSMKQDPDEYIKSFLAKTEFEKAIFKWTPDLLEELKGISKGAEIDYNSILMHQLQDEYWVDQFAADFHKCSSFGVDKSNTIPTITAQNLDNPTFYHGFQTVIKITEPSGKQMMLLTIPGFLGLTGMNNKGVSVNVNTLIQLDNSTRGLPVTFVVRGLVAQESQTEALNFLKKIEHAAGQNYIIGGPEKVYDFECSDNEKVEYRPFENSKFVYHTNHPLVNKDHNKVLIEDAKKKGNSIEETTVCKRFSSFEKRFGKETSDIKIEEIKEVLSSRDDNDGDVVSNENTFASVIYVLSENPEFLIAPGKPHETKYITLKFD